MRSFEHENTEKDRIRSLIIEATKTHVPNPKIYFTLPGKEMLDVKLFNTHFPKSIIIGLERNVTDFQAILNQNHPNFIPRMETISDYAVTKTPTIHHDVVFLDYLGPLTEQKRTEIRNFVGNDNILHPQKDFILAITLSKANRSGGTEETESFLMDILGNETEVNTIGNIMSVVRSDICEFASVELIESFQYVNERGAAPMYFILFACNKC